MNIARILYPIRVLGPGNRVGVWFCGCSRHCSGCSNPELWSQDPKNEITVSRLFSLIRQIRISNPIDGFTLSGGEPLEQSNALSELLPFLAQISPDILIYTGFTLDELRKKQNKAIQNILSHTAVLIDGSYDEARNDGCILRGSSNQTIHILNPYYRARYQQYLSEQNRNQIQNFTTPSGIISVGIHHRGFSKPESRKGKNHE